MNRLTRFSAPAVIFGLFASVAAADVSEEARISIDRVIGHKGTYKRDEGVYKIVLPSGETTIVQDYQTVSPNLGLNSWAAFTSGIHHEAVLTGHFFLLDDEVNPVLDVVLEAGLDVTGLAASCSFDGPPSHTIDVMGLRSLPTLASAFRKGLNAMQRVGRTRAISSKSAAKPTIPIESAINPGPLDAVLSLNGTVTAGAVAGTNDHALAQGECVESPNGRRKLLTALRARGLNIDSIRNHTLGEHPQSVFVSFWGEGTVLQLSKAVRYALNVQVGPSGSREKI